MHWIDLPGTLFLIPLGVLWILLHPKKVISLRLILKCNKLARASSMCCVCYQHIGNGFTYILFSVSSSGPGMLASNLLPRQAVETPKKSVHNLYV